jgi:hypothetical protein
LDLVIGKDINKMNTWDLPGGNKEIELPVSEDETSSQESSKVSLPLTNGGGLLFDLAKAAGVEIPAEQFGALDAFMDHARYGHQASLPMKCKGTSCPILDLCPLHKMKATLPIGKTCPVEGALVGQWVETYLGALDINPTDPESAIDMHMVYELAGLELLRTRAAQHLSTNPELIKREIVGFSPQGEEIWDDKPSMALLIMEKQAKTVSKLRDALLATRKAQAQVGHMAGDVSVRTANIQAKAKEILAKRLKGGNAQDVDEADYEVKE